MSNYYPATKKVEADVIAADGGVPVSCMIKDGKLVPALAAVQKGTAPENVLAAAYVGGCGTYLAAREDGIYESTNGEKFYNISSVTCSSPVILEEFYDGAPCGAVFNDAYCVYSDGDTVTAALHGGKQLSCGVMHCGRLFGADAEEGLLLRWSGEGGITDWYLHIYGAGWAYLSPECGKILNLIPYGEKLVAVRECGITEITANGTPENFKISSQVNFTGGVYANTAAVVGGDIYFFTKAGLCKYSGDITRVTHNLQGEISSPFCCAQSGGRYFSGGYSKTLGKNAIFVYDAAENAAYLIDAAPEALCAGDEVLVIGEGLTYALRTAENFTFRSGTFNFGTPYKKVLESVEIDSGGECDLTVSNGDISRIFTGVSGSVRLSMYGRAFKITVKASAAVRSICARAEVIDGL